MASRIPTALASAFAYLCSTDAAGETMTHKRGSTTIGSVVVLVRRDLEDAPRNPKAPDFSLRQVARLEVRPGTYVAGDVIEDATTALRYRIAKVERMTPHSMGLLCEVSPYTPPA